MSQEQILSSDGLPLEVSLKKAERKNKLKAVALVAPLFLFILIIYIFPIGDMLFRSVDDRMITKMLPKTFAAMEKWDGKDLPEEPVYKGLYEDTRYTKKNKKYGKSIVRLKYEKAVFSSINKKTVRKTNKTAFNLFFLSAFLRLTSKGIPSDDKICSLLIIKKGSYK